MIKRQMVKNIILILSLVLILGLVACGSQKSGEMVEKQTAAEVKTTETTEAGKTEDPKALMPSDEATTTDAKKEASEAESTEGQESPESKESADSTDAAASGSPSKDSDSTLKTDKELLINKGIELLVVENGEVKHEPLEVNFMTWLAEQDQPVFVDFWAEWCGYCIQAAPFIEELAKEFSGQALVVKIDVDQDWQLLNELKIMSLPTFMCYVDGEMSGMLLGYAPTLEPQIRGLIESALAAD